MTTTDMTTQQTLARQLIADKQAALDLIAEEVRASFAFIQEAHGQRRFSAFPVAFTVRYLHALWMCECKDMLLGVPQLRSTMTRYDGQYALRLLRSWQAGESGDVVAFLERKLDLTPFAEITREYERAERQGNHALARRLAHGRWVLLNRAGNLHHALAAIFALTPTRLIHQVQKACADYGHTVEQIDTQLAAAQAPVYGALRRPELARRNMLLMNTLGILVTGADANRPGRAAATAQTPTAPQRPYAEQVIAGEIALL